ncbi:unnamed protein product, partial [Owenia fusiformis]
WQQEATFKRPAHALGEGCLGFYYSRGLKCSFALRFSFNMLSLISVLMFICFLACFNIYVQLIRKSFLKCGLSNAMDGTEDDFLLRESDDEDDPFEGFTQTEAACAEEFHLNTQLILDERQYGEESGSESETEDFDMLEDPNSPGH